jgi:hypothetical protein
LGRNAKSREIFLGPKPRKNLYMVGNPSASGSHDARALRVGGGNSRHLRPAAERGTFRKISCPPVGEHAPPELRSRARFSRFLRSPQGSQSGRFGGLALVRAWYWTWSGRPGANQGSESGGSLGRGLALATRLRAVCPPVSVRRAEKFRIRRMLRPRRSSREAACPRASGSSARWPSPLRARVPCWRGRGNLSMPDVLGTLLNSSGGRCDLRNRGPSLVLGTVRHQARCIRRGWLEAVLEAYALISYHREHHGTELAVFLHRGEHVARA